ncbi:hypothetical protein CWR48_13925 [Oceanobacillus arenosus]|uniref:Helix-turn-helix domain containing protein n=1 Tax=Oceanobacillus arenosus TaxID=1229153 RepID=A0A3D8PNC3_9BACI|nr:hypothetical protein [Oceanobacillus arenosus]RDW17610.1 hypothetical protein CWR48_13925 [Oceanobacillus arenosus]
MKTDTYTIPYLPETGGYTYCLEELELAFPNEQLEEITERYNNGAHVAQIAHEIKRDPDEVFLALFHQGRHGKINKMAKSTLMVPGKKLGGKS